MSEKMKETVSDSIHSNKDKAGEDYWTSFWKVSELPPPFLIRNSDINTYPNKILDKLFREIFGNTQLQGKKLLEIGCGNSVFLSYFAKEFGFEVYGLDYSSYGCDQARKILLRDGVKGTILEGDAFNPPAGLTDSFDYVCSFGVVEHFADTSSTLRSFARFLKPGGTLITSIPNLAGCTGFLQKYLNKPVYDIHVPMDKKQLESALSKSGLQIFYSRYFLSVSFAVTLTGIHGEKIPGYTLKKIVVRLIRLFSKVIWLLENRLGALSAGRLFSGGIMTAAKRL